MYEYERTGIIHYDNKQYSYNRILGITAGSQYLDFPPSMGLVEPIIRTTDDYTMYASDYGLIRTEHSKESELILVLNENERERVFKRLLFDGWQPEFVGELGYIRCTASKVRYKKTRY